GQALDGDVQVPADVVVDQPGAVLLVLAVGNAVSGYEQIDLAFSSELFGALLGARGERRQHAAHALAQTGQGGLNAGAAGHQCGVNTQRALGPGGQLRVEVVRGVREGGEYDDLLVAAVDGVAALVFDHLAQRSQFCVTGGIDLFGRRQQCGQPVAVLDQILFPANQVNVAEQHLDLASDEQRLKSRVVYVDIRDVD